MTVVLEWDASYAPEPGRFFVYFRKNISLKEATKTLSEIGLSADQWIKSQCGEEYRKVFGELRQYTAMISVPESEVALWQAMLRGHPAVMGFSYSLRWHFIGLAPPTSLVPK